jgi:acyl-CoA thioesterase I
MCKRPAATGKKSAKAYFGLALLGLFLILGCDQQKSSAPPDTASPTIQTVVTKGVIAAVGDSLTAGYGLDESEAYPALLEKRLQAAGYDFKVINAGISGETTSGTRSRINWVLKLNPDIVILETGANDGLRGIDPVLVKKNLTAIIAALKAAEVTVILAGMQMVYNLGPKYRRAFNNVYPAVARTHGLILMPFFLKDVAGIPNLNQTDGIHPTPDGYHKIVDNIWPYVLNAIKRNNTKKI